MITEDILITSKDLMKWLNREITEDDEELCMYLSNAVKNQYEYHKEIERLNNIIDELEKYLKEPNITYTYDATDFGIEKIECVSVKDALNKLKKLKEGK